MTWFKRRPKWAAPTGEFVLGYRSKDKAIEIWNLNGINWTDAEVPPEKHDCYVQTRAIRPQHYCEWVFRCACGAIALDDTTYWMERNRRRAA